MTPAVTPTTPRLTHLLLTQPGRTIQACDRRLKAGQQAAHVAAGILAAHGPCPAADAALDFAEQALSGTSQCLRFAMHLLAAKGAAEAAGICEAHNRHNNTALRTSLDELDSVSSAACFVANEAAGGGSGGGGNTTLQISHRAPAQGAPIRPTTGAAPAAPVAAAAGAGVHTSLGGWEADSEGSDGEVTSNYMPTPMDTSCTPHK